jgi:hypothetical protein
MKIVISTDRQPFVNGKKTEKGEIHEVSDAAGKAMIANGLAIRGDNEPKRARNAKGHLKADDPSTPQNEAWEGGVAPKKPAKKKAKKKNAK